MRRETPFPTQKHRANESHKQSIDQQPNRGTVPDPEAYPKDADYLYLRPLEGARAPHCLVLWVGVGGYVKDMWDLGRRRHPLNFKIASILTYLWDPFFKENPFLNSDQQNSPYLMPYQVFFFLEEGLYLFFFLSFFFRTHYISQSYYWLAKLITNVTNKPYL
jgi:hypothetical protein